METCRSKDFKGNLIMPDDKQLSKFGVAKGMIARFQNVSSQFLKLSNGLSEGINTIKSLFFQTRKDQPEFSKLLTALEEQQNKQDPSLQSAADQKKLEDSAAPSSRTPSPH